MKKGYSWNPSGFFFYEWLERQERTAFKVSAAYGLMTTSISRAQRVWRYLKHFTGYNQTPCKTMVEWDRLLGAETYHVLQMWILL